MQQDVMKSRFAPSEHPGAQLLTVLAQVSEHLSFYRGFGVDGMLCGPAPVPPPPQPAVTLPPPTLETIWEHLKGCQRCKLHRGRTQIVFGAGNPQADLVFVGEGPGEHEDLEGKPFVGKAGELLTRIIAAIGLRREDVYITNIVKCRPPQNRDPEPDEIAACEPFLRQQLECIQPKIICALGRFAAQTLLQTEVSISKLRGRFHDYHGIKLMPTYHPAYLLRNPDDKRLVWEDMQLIQKTYHALSSPKEAMR